MYVSTKVKNAITIMKELHTQEPVNLGAIAEKHNLSRYFLEQIARKLRVAGLITSVRGPGGGYVLSQKRVGLLQVIDILKDEHVKHLREDCALDLRVREAIAGIQVV